MKKMTLLQGMELLLLLLLAVALGWAAALERTQQNISDHMIRLHVVANSDSPADQQMKLQVRDAVLKEAETLLIGAENQTAAKAQLRAGLSRLERTADETLSSSGSEEQAVVTLRRELFGTRRYESFSLPGGYYDALRVSIGSGEGRNWWCVVYPQICTAATTEDQRAVAAMGGLDAAEISILEGDSPEYELRFRALELLENLLGWFRSRSSGIPVSG